MTTHTETPAAPATFAMKDKNDVKTVFALADYLKSINLLDYHMDYSMQNLKEAWQNTIVYPEDTGSHPYDGAAYDTFWGLVDELDADTFGFIEMVEDENTCSVTLIHAP